MYGFIVNPNAGGGRAERLWRHLEGQLRRMRVEYRAFLTEKSGDATAFAAVLTEKCREPRNIVVVGGDGTMNEVLDGLAFCGQVTVGYIPAGSGNDLARSLKLPRHGAACLKKILNPKYLKLFDYGVLSYGLELHHRRFMVSAGIGLDAETCLEVMDSRIKQVLNKVCLGKLSYILIGLKKLLFFLPVKGYLVLDGIQKVEFNHIYFVSAHIHSYEGGGFRFAPGADPCDGKLTICVVHHEKRRKILPILLGAFLGSRHKRHGVRNYTCQEAEIHLERPMAVHVDGERCLCQKDLHVRCIPQKVRMMV